MTDKDDRLVERLQGLNVDPAALEGDPFAKRMNWRSTLLSSGRGWVAAAIAVGVLMLGWRFSAPVSQQVTRVVPAGAVTQLLADNPSALKQQIVDDLRGAGIEAIGYDRLGLSGVDAAVATPVAPGVHAILLKHGIPAPADGVVRVEIRASRQ